MGLRFWEYYIRLPQEIVDDPAIDLSHNGFRLICYLCRHQLRIGKSILRLSQDDILNGRKDKAGVRVDVGAKLAGPRHLIAARQELITLGWLRYYPLEGAYVYELVVQDQPLEHPAREAGSLKEPDQFPKGTGAGSLKEPGQFPKGTDSGSLKEPKRIIRKLHKNTSINTREAGACPGTPSEGAVGFHATLNGLAQGSASQPPLYDPQKALDMERTRGEGFNAVEVAHAMCIELTLVGHDHRIFLAEVLDTYTRKNPKRTFEQAGEDLLALWAEYQRENLEFAAGWKKFFSEGIYAKKDTWKKSKRKQSAPAGQDAAVLIQARSAQIGATKND